MLRFVILVRHLSLESVFQHYIHSAHFKMIIKTAFFLMVTMALIPTLAFYFAPDITSQQLKLLYDSSLVMSGFALGCYVLSELADNYSQVDKIWSIAPVVYCWHITKLLNYGYIEHIFSLLIFCFAIYLKNVKVCKIFIFYPEKTCDWQKK